MNITVQEFADKVRSLGHTVQNMDINFTRADNRVWSVLISPGEKNIMVFFYKNRKDYGDYGFDILSEKKVYFSVSVYNIYDAIDQVLIEGKYDEQQ